MKTVRLLSLLALLILTGTLTIAADKTGPKLTAALTAMNENDRVYAWVFFTDKGRHEQLRNAVPLDVVSPRSIQRRLKVRAANNVVDYTDLPVEQQYVEQLAQHVLLVRQQSKWFNAASVIATKAQIREIEELPFVDNMELLYRAKTTRELDQQESPADSPMENGGQGGNQVYDLNYGGSLGQNQMVNIPAVHNTGNYAQGVLVGVFDNGIRLLNTHQTFDSLRPRIIAQYDFVDKKVSVVPNNPSTGFGSHGVNTLSLIGGYTPGTLIGPAFGASYILARTENDSSETPIEEDYWAAGIEWADSIGVDVTSTSLGYLDYDPPYTSWTWQDMNGNTTVITRAADMAVAKGIIVCNSAGNAGNNASRNTLGAPADGDSVLAIGALTSSGTRAGYSSVGPTTSVPPRIKPDVMAQGSQPVYASGSNPTGYSSSGSGTSFSCPIAAGVAALVLNARPNATAMQIANALKSTASNAASPNNLIGWGTLNAVAAINALPATGVGQNQQPSDFRLEQNYPNPFNPTTTIRFALPVGGATSLKVFDVLGREVATLLDMEMQSGTHHISVDASRFASGTYFYKLQSGNNIAVRKFMVLK